MAVPIMAALDSIQWHLDLRSRVIAGLERASARGVRLGHLRTVAKGDAAIRDRLARRDGVKKIAEALGV